jgi:hypothetical protein
MSAALPANISEDVSNSIGKRATACCNTRNNGGNSRDASNSRDARNIRDATLGIRNKVRFEF